jgi:hypothetical protein
LSTTPRRSNAAIELTIRRPLPDYDLDEIEHSIPRDVDPMLASQGFHDLLDEARGILAKALQGNRLEVVQLTGAICSEGRVHRPGAVAGATRKRRRRQARRCRPRRKRQSERSCRRAAPAVCS